MTENESMIEKIQKLMALAERAGTKEEAQLAFSKAQTLMSKYAIDEATLALKRLGHDVVIESEIINIGSDRSCQTLFSIVARNNNCSIIYLTTTVRGQTDRYFERNNKLQIFGAKSDIEFTKMLYASLLMFCENSLLLMREVAPDRYGGKSVAYNYRLGFATGVGSKMAMARETAMREDATPGTELVLVSRAKRADEALSMAFPETVKRSAIAIRNRDAYDKGKKRGTQADVSGGRNNLGTERGQLN